MSERLNVRQNIENIKQRNLHQALIHAIYFGTAADALKYLERPNKIITEEELTQTIQFKINDINLSIKNYTPTAVTFAPIYKAQLRAIDYLYGKGTTIGSAEANPLVDILTLISHPKRSFNAIDFQLTTRGEPLPKPILASSKPANKTEQRTYDNDDLNREEYRTITEIRKNLKTVISGMFILAEASKAHPSIVSSALSQYEALIPYNYGKAEGMALGLLEILHNTHLLYDRRFYNLASQLRGIVLESVGDYNQVKKAYAYSIVRERAFWYKGEEQRVRNHEKFKYIPAAGRGPETHSEANLPIPLFDNWPVIARNRAELTRMIRQLTITNSIKSATPNFSTDKALTAIKRDRITRASLIEERRNLESKQLDNLKKAWRGFIEDYIDENVIIENDEVKFVDAILSKVVTLFKTDNTLSQKAKTNFVNSGKATTEGYYGLKTEVLLKDPLFHWILAMRIPETRRAFRDSVARSSENTTAFYLFLRLITFEAARVSFQTKELDFLYDPTFTQKISPEYALAFLDSILSNIQNYVPDTRRLTWAILPKTKRAVSDLINPGKLKRIESKLDELKYRDIFGLRSRIPKAIGFSQEDKEMLKKVAKGTGRILGLLGIYSLLGTGLFFGVKTLADFNAFRDKSSGNISDGGDADPNAKPADDGLATNQGGDSTQKQSRFFEWLDKVLPKKEPPTPPDGSGGASDGSFTAIEDRIPDAINPENLKNIGPAIYGEILHVPEGSGMSENGAAVGYFPWNASMMVNWQQTSVDSWIQRHSPDGVSQQPFTAFVRVESFDDSIVYDPADLYYVIKSPNQIIYPPIGWRITSIYQVGGSDPRQGSIGELYYDQAPTSVLLGVEKVIETYVGGSGRIKYADAFQTAGYDVAPLFNPELPAEVNLNLAGDTVLQQLHADYINDLTASFAGGPEAESAVIVRYAELYAQYTNTYRYYALNFQVDKEFVDAPADATDIDRNYATIETIAAYYDKGYFCSVAAYAFRDFIASGSVATAVQPGITLYNYYDTLIGQLAHENNLVYLPNGKILEVDMTPPVTSRTPQADIDALMGKPFTDRELKRMIDKRNAKPVDYEKYFLYTLGGIFGIAGLLGLGAAGEAIYSNAKAKFIAKRIRDSLDENRDLNELEKELILAATARLSLLAYDNTFPETASAILSSLEAYDRKKYDYAIRWMTNDAAGLLEEQDYETAFKKICETVKTADATLHDEIQRNLPWEVFEDIERVNQGAENIESPYDFAVIFNLSKILYDRDLWNLTRDVYRRLGVPLEGATDLALKYKVNDILDLLKRRYASKKTPISVKPIFNGMYRLIRTELTEVEKMIPGASA